jgi:hypothetical protein
MSWRVFLGIVLAAVLMAGFKHLPAQFREAERPVPSPGGGSLLDQHERDLSATEGR